MRFGKKHKTMIVLSILLFFLSSAVVYSSSLLFYRDKMHETDVEFNFLSDRTSLIQDREYYKNDKSLDPTESENYNSIGFYPYPSNNANNFRYEEWTKVYITDNDDYENLLKENNIINANKIIAEKEYKSRLPLDNKMVLGEKYFNKNPKDTMLIFIKGHKVLDYYYIDQRIVDFSDYKNEKGYKPSDTFILKLDENDMLYIDKVEDNEIYNKSFNQGELNGF